jgi:Zn-dependent protease with chaperone function
MIAQLIVAAAAALLLPQEHIAAARKAPSEDHGSALRADDHRVAAIAYRLGRSGLRFCSSPYPLTGLLLHHLPEYDPPGRALMMEAYELHRGPGVLTVLEGSPASAAGLRAGDVLLSINDRPFPSPLVVASEPDREKWRREIVAIEHRIESELGKGPARLQVLRNGRQLLVTLGSIAACPTRVRLARSDQVNAFANDGYVIMTTAMLNFTRSDDELALVIAHELAHNILGHPERLREQKVPTGGFFRSFGKNASRVKATEEEADRLGINLLWAAGYDVEAAVPFWRRLHARFDKGPQLFRTHPDISHRERLIHEILGEVNAGGQTRVRSDQSSGKARLESVD